MRARAAKGWRRCSPARRRRALHTGHRSIAIESHGRDGARPSRAGSIGWRRTPSVRGARLLLEAHASSCARERAGSYRKPRGRRCEGDRRIAGHATRAPPEPVRRRRCGAPSRPDADRSRSNPAAATERGPPGRDRSAGGARFVVRQGTSGFVPGNHAVGDARVIAVSPGTRRVPLRGRSCVDVAARRRRALQTDRPRAARGHTGTAVTPADSSSRRRVTMPAHASQSRWCLSASPWTAWSRW